MTFVTPVTSHTPDTSVAAAASPEASIKKKLTGPGARLSDNELIAQLEQRQAKGRCLDLPSTQDLMTEEEMALSLQAALAQPLPDSFAGLFNGGHSPYAPLGQIILPIVLDPRDRQRIFIGFPRSSVSYHSAHESAKFSPLQPFQSYADRRLSSSESFTRIFEGLLQSSRIETYYRHAAKLNSYQNTPSNYMDHTVNQDPWPRRSGFPDAVTVDRVALSSPVFCFDYGCNLGNVSSSAGSNWNAHAFIRYLNGASKDIVIPSIKNTSDPVRWLPLSDLNSFCGYNPTVELLAAILKLSAVFE